jgi:hypothetical protein
MILLRIKLCIQWYDNNSFIKHASLFKLQVLKQIQLKMPADIIFKNFFKNLNHTTRESKIGSFVCGKVFQRKKTILFCLLCVTHYKRKYRSVYIDQCSSKRFRLPAPGIFLFVNSDIVVMDVHISCHRQLSKVLLMDHTTQYSLHNTYHIPQ